MPCHLPTCFTVGVDPVLVRIGPVAIAWEGLLIAVGFVIAVRLLLSLAEREQIDPDETLSAALVAALFALLAARLFFVLTNQPGYYLDPRHMDQLLSLSISGLSFFGGLLGGVFGAWLYISRRRLPLIRVLDLAAVAAPLGQAIGRIGNLVNGDERGLLTSGFGVRYTNSSNQFVLDRLGRTSHPVALYQAAWDIALFVLLLYVYRRLRPAPGRLAGVYLLGYGVGEVVIAAFAAAPAVAFGLKTAQLLGVLAAAVGFALVLGKRGRAGEAVRAAP